MFVQDIDILYVIFIYLLIILHGHVFFMYSKTSQDVLNQQEPEKDLFELPPLPEDTKMER